MKGIVVNKMKNFLPLLIAKVDSIGEKGELVLSLKKTNFHKYLLVRLLPQNQILISIF
jgi:hypothetical protein